MTDLERLAAHLVTVAQKRMPRDEGAAARYVADELRHWSYKDEEHRRRAVDGLPR